MSHGSSGARPHQRRHQSTSTLAAPTVHPVGRRPRDGSVRTAQRVGVTPTSAGATARHALPTAGTTTPRLPSTVLVARGQSRPVVTVSTASRASASAAVGEPIGRPPRSLAPVRTHRTGDHGRHRRPRGQPADRDVEKRMPRSARKPSSASPRRTSGSEINVVCAPPAGCPPACSPRLVYLPVSRPLASGKYGRMPRPKRSHASTSSRSTSRSSRLYSFCALTNRACPGAGPSSRRRRLPGGEVRMTEVADLALPDQLVQGRQRLVDRGGRIRPMQLVQVDVVGPQPAQRPSTARRTYQREPRAPWSPRGRRAGRCRTWSRGPPGRRRPCRISPRKASDSPYTSAVSKNVTPTSSAASTTVRRFEVDPAAEVVAAQAERRRPRAPMFPDADRSCRSRERQRNGGAPRRTGRAHRVTRRQCRPADRGVEGGGVVFLARRAAARGF